ncbi:MAG TPA: SRPBCC family protein [Burkholderiales bacterium]|nr:SRPBCC family protein [Burkholderiales bacterium]
MTIECPPLDVYNFVSDPKNLSKWASGLSGAVKVRFVERNKYGVLDHYVSVDSGPEVYMPMRVFPNGEGSELLITVFRQPGVTEEKFVDDTKWVRRDLEALKQLLEK